MTVLHTTTNRRPATHAGAFNGRFHSDGHEGVIGDSVVHVEHPTPHHQVAGCVTTACTNTNIIQGSSQ